MGTVNEDIRDDLIEHDIAVRRAIGGEQRRVEAIHRQLERDVIALYLSTTPTTPLQQARFFKKVKIMSAESYHTQFLNSKQSLRKLAHAESEAINSAIEEALPAP